jgi:hypothetical protein
VRAGDGRRRRGDLLLDRPLQGRAHQGTAQHDFSIVDDGRMQRSRADSRLQDRCWRMTLPE